MTRMAIITTMLYLVLGSTVLIKDEHLLLPCFYSNRSIFQSLCLGATFRRVSIYLE
jgi:hypothetical protein